MIVNSGATLAAKHLERARQGFDAGDETAAVVWSSLCAQVAIALIAREHGVDTRRDHFQRASAARRLFDTGVLEKDVGDLLIRLNEERKCAIYDGRAPDLRGRTWEDVFDVLGYLVEVAGRSAQ